MKLAHLILAHKDPKHIGRLSKKLSVYSDVYIHIDCSIDEGSFRKAVGNVENIFFTKKRFRCWWGGYNAIKAEIQLLTEAMQTYGYDRLVFLQGADYPLKDGNEILSFFRSYEKKEFIHCTPCSRSHDLHHYRLCHCYWFYNNPNLLKRAWNKLNQIILIPLRDGRIYDGDKKFEVYWGCAQWAVTGKCAEYIIDFYFSHKKVNEWFKYAFPVDELYINTVVMNSPFSQHTFFKNNKPVKNLGGLRNLTYFEYPSTIKIFTKEDFTMLQEREELYCRKVNTYESAGLLDMLDALHDPITGSVDGKNTT